MFQIVQMTSILLESFFSCLLLSLVHCTVGMYMYICKYLVMMDEPETII